MFFGISVRVFRFEDMQRLICRTSERSTHAHIDRQSERFASCLWRHNDEQTCPFSLSSSENSRRKAAMAGRRDKINIYFARAAVCCCDYVCPSLFVRVCVLCVPVLCYKIRWLSSAFQWGRCGAQPGDVLLHQISKRLLAWFICRVAVSSSAPGRSSLSIFLSLDWKLRNFVSVAQSHWVCIDGGLPVCHEDASLADTDGDTDTATLSGHCR